MARTAWMEAGGHLNDSALFVAEYLLRFLRVAALLALWRVVMGSREEAAGMTLNTLLTYTLVSEAYAEMLSARTYLDYMMWEGKLATLFLQPMGLIASVTSQSAGRWMTGFAFFSAPLLLAAPLLGVSPFPASAANGLLFALSLVLAIMVGLAVDFVFSTLTVALQTNPWLTSQIRGAVSAMLSGALLPLAILPWGLGRVFGWLPFASMASAPLRVYTGAGNPAELLAIQALWAAGLWPFALWLWRVNREKLACYGG